MQKVRRKIKTSKTLSLETLTFLVSGNGANARLVPKPNIYDVHARQFSHEKTLLDSEIAAANTAHAAFCNTLFAGAAISRE